MALRKLELMHRMFGKNEGHTCGECDNLCSYRYRSKRYRKCQIYGLTNSEASDWAKRWTACGKFNSFYHGEEIIKLVRPDRNRTPIPDEPLQDQISIFGGNEDG